MTVKTYEVDPISRIEGHLGVKVTTENGLTQVAAQMGKYTYLNDGAWKVWTRGISDGLDAGGYTYYTPGGDPTTWSALSGGTAVTFAAGTLTGFTAPTGSISVLKDGANYLAFVGKCNANGSTNGIGCFTSTDGFTFTGIGYFVAPGWAVGSVDAPSVIKDGADFKMWYHGNSAARSIGYTKSTDCITWDAGTQQVQISGAEVLVQHPWVVKEASGAFTMYYSAQVNPGPAMALGHAVSPDGLTWSKKVPVLKGLDIYEPGVFTGTDGVTRVSFMGYVSLKYTFNTLLPAPKITEANAHGNLWRGFENFLVGRRVNDAITFTQRICGVCPVPHGMAATHAADSVMGVSDGYATFDNTGGAKGIPSAGLLVRNLVLASEFLMSSITHFYHLAAQSYIQGPAMPPWTPYFDDLQYHPVLRNERVPGTPRALPEMTGGVPNNLWSAVIKQYVKALRIRRLTFEASAMFAGRAPMMSMSIAGGTTNAFRSQAEFEAKCDAFKALMVEVGEFVVREYIPLAFALGALYPDFDSQNASHEGYGAGVGNFLAWGGFPETGASGDFKIKGGWKLKGGSVTDLVTKRSDVATIKPEIVAHLEESIARSRYEDFGGQFGTDHKAYPGNVTRTQPKRNGDADATGSYSWLKAPRWAGNPMEVGPLARMVINGMYVTDGSQLLPNTYCSADLTATAAAANGWPAAYGWLYLNASGNALDGRTVHGDLLGGLAGDDLAGVVTGFLAGITGGLSTMDRLRGRAIESFHVISWILGLPSKKVGGVEFVAGNGWIDRLKATADVSSGVNKFAVVATPGPDRISGFGLVEAPRGALGHFVTADNGKIVSYQCVVPTTWNASPKDGVDVDLRADNTGDTKRGPMEQAMMGVTFDSEAVVASGGGSRISGVEVLRVAQSFDPCIACAVH